MQSGRSPLILKERESNGSRRRYAGARAAEQDTVEWAVMLIVARRGGGGAWMADERADEMEDEQDREDQMSETGQDRTGQDVFPSGRCIQPYE